MEIRAKDKIFLAVFLPVALIGAYIYFWRIDAGKRDEALARQQAALVAVDEYPAQKLLRERDVAAAEAELAAEKAIPRSDLRVVGNAAESAAERERNVIRILRESGLVVVRSEMEKEPRGDSAACVALQSSGIRPTPRLCRYVLDGAYPAVKRALDAFRRERTAAIAERIDMRSTGFARWTLEIWE